MAWRKNKDKYLKPDHHAISSFTESPTFISLKFDYVDFGLNKGLIDTETLIDHFN